VCCGAVALLNGSHLAKEEGAAPTLLLSCCLFPGVREKQKASPQNLLLFHSDTTEQNRISFEAVTGQALQHSYKGEFSCQRAEFPNAFPFLHIFISINLCRFLKNLFWGEGEGTEQALSYSELKEEIPAARGKAAEERVSVADDRSPLRMPLLKHQGVRVSPRGCASPRQSTSCVPKWLPWHCLSGS